MEACLESINSLLERYYGFLESMKSKARSCLRKLGVDEDLSVVNARLTKTCKSSRGPCYVTLEISLLYQRRKISFGRIEKFDRRVLEQRLRKFDITIDELDALLSLKRLKRIVENIKRIEYHAMRIKDLSESLDVSSIENMIDDEIKFLKQIEVAARW